MSFNYELILSIILFAFVSSSTPGPNNMMMLASGVNFGFKKSIPHLLGITIGSFIMLLAIGFGLDRIFKIFPLSFHIMKILGFLYILYLSWKISNTAPTKRVDNQNTKPFSFIQAAVFQWVNPKAIIIAITFFTNYVPANAIKLEILFYSTILGLINLPSVSIWLILGLKLEHLLKNNKTRKIFNYTMAILLILSMIPTLFLEN